MATVFGRTWTRGELEERTGDPSQLARIRMCRSLEGFEDGVVAADVITGGGLQFTVVPSRGLDISMASYKGIPLAWRSAQGDRHPSYYEPEGLGWLRSFPGGLLTTCGLSWMGAPDVDNGRELGLHGRYSNTPATNVRTYTEWQGDEYILRIEGTMREAVVFGENLSLKRTITTRLGATSLILQDTVRNDGFEPSPHMILYHVNIGFPVVDEGARVVISAGKTEARDEDALDGMAEWMHAHKPRPGYREKVYFHDVEPGGDGYALAAVVNPTIEGGLAVYVRYRPDQLPHFVQWKMLGQGTYVIGLEPANARVLGRSKEREAGRLSTLAAGEEKCYELEMGVLTGEAALQLLSLPA